MISGESCYCTNYAGKKILSIDNIWRKLPLYKICGYMDTVWVMPGKCWYCTIYADIYILSIDNVWQKLPPYKICGYIDTLYWWFLVKAATVQNMLLYRYYLWVMPGKCCHCTKLAGVYIISMSDAWRMLLLYKICRYIDTIYGWCLTNAVTVQNMRVYR